MENVCCVLKLIRLSRFVLMILSRFFDVCVDMIGVIFGLIVKSCDVVGLRLLVVLIMCIVVV